MKWVTRKRIQVNRAATAWLIRRFIDPQAEFLFVEPDQVADIQASEGALGFDAPGARYAHQDGQGRCSFEALVEERCAEDGALKDLARIIHEDAKAFSPGAECTEVDDLSVLPEDSSEFRKT